MHAIRTENLCRTYRAWRKSITVLKGLDLDVNAGEIFGYLGPNGAGKTTTLNLLMGFARPTSGRAWLFGRPVRDPAARRCVGFMPENLSFPAHLRCEELLFMHGLLAGLGRNEARRRVSDLLEETGLGEVASRRARELSKGMLQWLGLAQALVGEPDLLILDEPMSGLDPIGRRKMRELILKQRAGGVSVFFSSHILGDVEMICDRVGILLGGELVQCGRLNEILDRDPDGVEIRVFGLPSDVVLRIENCGGTVRSFGEETLIEINQRDQVDWILEWVREAGAHVRSLVARRESLEDHFIKWVAETQRQGSGAIETDSDMFPVEKPEDNAEKRPTETMGAGKVHEEAAAWER